MVQNGTHLNFTQSRPSFIENTEILGFLWLSPSLDSSWCISFQIMSLNIIFHFLSAKIDFFCEASIKNMVQNGTHPIFTQCSLYFMDNTEILGIFSLST